MTATAPSPALRRAVVLVAFVGVLVGIGAGSAQTLQHTLDHDGASRSYTLHLPADLTTPRPLVVLLHGRNGTGEGMARLTDFDRIADRHGVIAVYPDGLDAQWNYPRGVPGYPARPDDVAFLLALIDHLADRYPVDADRLYVAGLSNGGFMAQRLACEAADVFAAFASVAAAGYGGMPDHCREVAPVSILLMHGTADTNIPWGGLSRRVGEREVTLLAAVPLTFSFWAARSGCEGLGEPRELPERGDSPGTHVRVLGAVGCPAGVEVVLYAVVGGGHNWPGRPGVIPDAVAGLVNTDIDAGEEIWSFFARHPRSAR